MNSKKIAFIGDPWVGAVKRLAAFIKLSPKNYEFTFVNAEEGMNLNRSAGRSNETIVTPPLPPGLKESIFLDEFHPANFDLVLPLNDKHFSKTTVPPIIPNLTNKVTLNDTVRSFGFPLSPIPANPPSGPVFVKPIVGAGQYTTDSLSYRKHPNTHTVLQNPDFNSSTHLIQEYIPTEHTKINFVTFASNGKKTLKLIDFTEATHATDKNTQKNINIHLESKLFSADTDENFFTATARDFIQFTQYDTIPGIFMLQFMTYTHRRNNTYFLNDFNVRSGPAADHATVFNIFPHRVHSMIPFMLSDEKEETSIEYPHVRYCCYLTDLITDIPLDPIILPNFNTRVLCTEDTQSGLIRNDYNTYIEIL